MTEPFDTPPPLSDDFATRTHQRATQLRQRRRASIVGVAALLLLLAGIAYSATGGAKQPDAQIHVAGSTTLDGAVSVGGSTSTSGASTTRPARTSTTGRGATSGTAPHDASGPDDGSGPKAPATTSTPEGTRGSGSIAPTTTADVWACPAGGTVTISAVVHATAKGAGEWYIDGTVTIDNQSGGAVGTIGWVNLVGATIPGSPKQAGVGWQDNGPLDGSPYDLGQLWVDPHSTATFPLNQTRWMNGDGANALGADPPETIENGGVWGGWMHPWNSCPGLHMVTTFLGGGSFPTGP